MPMLFWFPMIILSGVYGLVNQAPKTRQSGPQTNRMSSRCALADRRCVRERPRATPARVALSARSGRRPRSAA